MGVGGLLYVSMYDKIFIYWYFKNECLTNGLKECDG